MGNSSSSPQFTVSDAGCAVVRLNRPQHHNRVEPSDLESLHQMLAGVERDEAIRVLVLTGVGPTFCSGYDLVTLSRGGAAGNADHDSEVRLFEDLVNRLESCRVPTICGLNGPVYGGGADLALACDFRVGVTTTRVVIPATELGVHYYHGGMRRFVTRLGLGAAMRLLLLCEPLDAAEMLRVGFLSELVPTQEALEKRVTSIAETVIAQPVPAVTIAMKRALNRIAAGDLDPAETDAAWAASIRSPTVALAAAERLAARRHAAKKES